MLRTRLIAISIALIAIMQIVPATLATVLNAPAGPGAGVHAISTVGYAYEGPNQLVRLQAVPSNGPVTVLIVNGDPHATYSLVGVTGTVQTTHATAGGLVIFSSVSLSDQLTVKGPRGLAVLSGPGATQTSPDFFNYCDFASGGSTSADNKVSFSWSIYRPYCDATIDLQIGGGAIAGCSAQGIDGSFSYMGQPVYTWNHQGDPSGLASTGDYFPCDGGIYGVYESFYEDCGVGSLVVTWYGNFGGFTSTAEGGDGGYTAYSPCLALAPIG